MTLDPQALQRGLGWIPDRRDERDHVAGFGEAGAVIPALPPLSKVNLVTKHMPPIWDQGRSNACVLYSAATLMLYEGSLLRQQRFDPSMFFAWYGVREMEGTADQNIGTYPRDALKFLTKNGICTAQTWPNDLKKYKVRPSEAAWQEAPRHTVTEYLVIPQNRDAIIATLRSGHPFMFGMDVYTSLLSAEVAETGVLLMPQSGEKWYGRHMVVAVGYDLKHPAGEMVRIRNSWGSAWGDDGYFWMPLEFLLKRYMVSDLWMVRRTKNS